MNKNIFNSVHGELLSACRKGSSKAQFEIYKLYYKAMYNTALRILDNTVEAEDVMQESFLSAFQKLETFKGEVSFGAWLKKIVVNKSLDIVKSRRALISIDETPDVETSQEEAEEQNYSDLDPATVKRALYDLPEGYRIVLSLYLLEGYDHDEISQILNISNATSRTQYHRAKKRLAEKLNNIKAVS